MAPPRLAVVVKLLAVAAVVAAHGDEHEKMGGTNSTDEVDKELWVYDMQSYFNLPQHSGMMTAHILFMTAAWFLVLPIGVMFSIGRSRLALPVQLVFLALNGIGVVLGTAYNVSTPDLYESNAHHSIGWIATWIMTAQVIMSLLFVYAGRNTRDVTPASERAAFLPTSFHGVNHLGERPYAGHRWSGDSGHGTEPPSPRNQSREFSSISPHTEYMKPKRELDSEDEEEDDEIEVQTTSSNQPQLSRNNFLNKYLLRIPQVFSSKLLRVMDISYEVIDRTILILGFIALTTGGVTYTGIFRSSHIFNGLAHFIKGGVFFWYGLLTLGRWMGSFADWGWAWNIKPTRSEIGRSRAHLPSAEFAESFLIFFYGSTNVFLEHLTAWGKRWTAQDFEHVAITVMFFGGGLLGMLIESKTVRGWLNTSVDMMPARVEVHSSDAQEVRVHPKTYSFSMNPIPGLVVLLLGIMMSSHHQSSEVSTMVHKQWGTLLCGAAFARGLTYVLTYLSPPSSIYPSRPPTELVTAFCLISGGLIFMASTLDIVHYMETHGLMAMFVFTVTMGFTALLMAFQVFVIALKGWAIRRETKLVSRY